MLFTTISPPFILFLAASYYYCAALMLLPSNANGNGVMQDAFSFDEHDQIPRTEESHESHVKSTPMLWPLPFNFTNGHDNSGVNSSIHGRVITRSAMILVLSRDFQFIYALMMPSNSTNEQVGSSSRINAQSPILDEAFQRYRDLIFGNHKASSTELFNQSQHLQLMLSLHIDVESLDETLRFGTDESYSLAAPDPRDPTRVYVKANTVFGALRGLETFSQLCTFHFQSRSVHIVDAPWSIYDKPRFPYRGLLIDTARHYQPIRFIKQVIDSMAYAKLNVLHWHIVDTQSFPLEIRSYPNLSKGSYSIYERYTIDDAKDVVEYARKRGINVMPELDVPGHAASWGVGYPQLWPSKTCTQPLDVSTNFTFSVIDGILSDLSKVFPFDFVHMGGDEVNTSCWTTTPRIYRWLRRNNFTDFEAYKYFVLQAESISLSHGFTPINWEEPFDNFGHELNKKAVIHNWLGPGVCKKVVKAGLRCIVSNQDVWYLDHLDVTWEKFYKNEPLANITDASKQALVLGGEVCMWGETVDASDLLPTIWPRAAAAAERLWSSLERIAKDPRDALPRLHRFRCLLNQRGIAAAPVHGSGRVAPSGPSSCYSQ